MDKKLRFRRGLYRFFLGIDIFFGILTLIFLFVFPPIGLIGIAVTVLYALVAISIKQSINGMVAQIMLISVLVTNVARNKCIL